MSAPAWTVGMERIAPGIYARGEEIHLDTIAVCEAMGIPYNEENETAVNAAVYETIQKHFSHPIEVIQLDDAREDRHV